MLMVLISLIPLLIAGVGNYSAVKQSILQAEIEKKSSKQSMRANILASEMAIRKAEVLVMSRTEEVRFGTDKERLDYFGKELVRTGFNYYTIGYISVNGMGIRTDGRQRDMSNEPFFAKAIQGEVVITDPYTPTFANTSQIFIVVPVYEETSEVKGLVYASILFSSLHSYFKPTDEEGPMSLYNDAGEILYTVDTKIKANSSLFDKDSSLLPVADNLLGTLDGMVKLEIKNKQYALFHTKVNGTPWRFALQEPISKVEEMLAPIFWRIFITIALSEVIIVIFFYLYFESIIVRLKRILGVTEQAADGRFEAEHLAVEPNDEIGQLAHSVNGMMLHLQEMFDRLEAIINQNQYAFIVLDDQYKVTYLNKTAEELLGYTTEEVSGHATPLLFMDLEEIREEAEQLSVKLGRTVQPGLEVFKELRHESFSYEREWTFIHKDGTRIPTLHSSNGLRDRNGRFSGVVGMVLDISDRKHVEKARNRLLDIVESAKDLIASVDARGKVIYVNRAGKEMLSIENGHHTVEQYMQPQMYAELVRGADLAREHGFWESETQLMKSDGESLHVSMVVVAHQNERTGELFFSCIARDIMEQKTVQEELVRATLEAEEANRAKSSFLARMSHEIRTPLNGIIGLTQLMRKTGLSASQKDYMDKMNTSSESLLHIINDVLDFSKIEAGKIDMERLPFKLDDLLHRITDQLSVFMGGKEQFEFMVDMPEYLPQTIIGDAMRLEQVLLNLCMNAIKFTNRGIVRLRLDITKERDNKVTICFCISDTGIGMTQEQVDKLFKPFMQADGSTTRKFGGTGLGLVISKALVEIMGGKLKVESTAKVGSQFYFQLDFEAEASRQEQHLMVREDMREQPVWIVEDDEAMRAHWSAMIEAYGLTPLTFDSWKIAKERLRRIGAGAIPKLILLDMEMPDMYGTETWLDFHKEAKAAGVKTIAMTTSYGRDEMLQLSVEQRPLSLLIKPVMRSGMIKVLCGAFEMATMDGNWQESVAAAASIEDIRESNHTRILLAEDNKINQLVAIEILKERGYEVGLAENGQEALDKLVVEQWDLILMDIHMPIMDGAEAVQIIRSQSQYDKIPIIAVTANILRHDHEQYLKLGMNDVVTKPIDGERLHGVISYWLKKAGLLEADASSEPSVSINADRMLSVENNIGFLPQIVGMDVDAAIARVNGKLPILIHMMEQFRQDYETFIDQLRMLVKHGEMITVTRMVHTLRGAAGYLSAYDLADATSDVDLRIRQEELNPLELQASINRLEKELEKLLKGLQEFHTAFDKKT